MPVIENNKRAIVLVDDMMVERLTDSGVVRKLFNDVNSNIISILNNESDSWIRQLYYVCYRALNNMHDSETILNHMKKMPIIACYGSKFVMPDETYIMPFGEVPKKNNLPMVRNSVIYANGRQQDEISGGVLKFLHTFLEIDYYGSKVEIEKIIKGIESKKSGIGTNYYENMLKLAEYEQTHNDINFSSKRIFLCNSGRSFRLAKSKECVLGKPYITAGDMLADITGNSPLWKGYYDKYSAEELKMFLDFAENVGVVGTPHIVRQSVKRHELFSTHLFIDGKETINMIDEDYTIINLQPMLKRRSLKINKLIWNAIIEEDESMDYTQARYAPNKKDEPRCYDSSLIYYLKNISWVPDKNSKLHRPENIRVEDIKDDFVYKNNSLILKALEFGKVLDEKEKTLAQLEKHAEENGLHLISDNEFSEYNRWKQMQIKKANRRQDKTIEEIVESQNRNKSSYSDTENVDVFEYGAVRDIDRSITKIDATFDKMSKMPKSEKAYFASVRNSNKEEKEQLEFWYEGTCQMCKTRIMTYKGKPHFVAKNILASIELPEKVEKTETLGWNSLSLCPNCAAKYSVCSKNLTGFIEQIKNEKVEEQNKNEIKLYIEMDDKEQVISFLPKHFLVLQRVIKRLLKHKW